MRFSTSFSLLAFASMASAELPTLPEHISHRLVVSPGTAQVCPLDFHLYDQNGDTPPAAPPITITQQDTTTVQFSVNNLWAADGVDNIFVEYTTDDLGSTSCVEEVNFGELDTIDLTAYCLCTQPIAIVNIYVADPEVTGDAEIPQCCHDGANPLPMNTVQYTYILQCEPTCDDEPFSECPEEVLDFNDLPELSYVYDEYWSGRGIKITAKADTTDVNLGHTPIPDPAYPTGSAWQDRYGFTENNPTIYTDDQWVQTLHNPSGGAARVFNTLRPDGNRGNNKCQPNNGNEGDKDLGSPNRDCPAGTPGLLNNGPGVGNGGKPTTSFPNCPSELLGNVLIVQEKVKSCPDDTSAGGFIMFDFNPNIAGTIDFLAVKMLDADDGDEPTITVWTEFEDLNSPASTPSITGPIVGNNGLWIDDFTFPSGIKRVRFDFPGSGSIAEIKYRPTICYDEDICSMPAIQKPK